MTLFSSDNITKIYIANIYIKSQNLKRIKVTINS